MAFLFIDFFRPSRQHDKAEVGSFLPSDGGCHLASQHGGGLFESFGCHLKVQRFRWVARNNDNQQSPSLLDDFAHRKRTEDRRRRSQESGINGQLDLAGKSFLLVQSIRKTGSTLARSTAPVLGLLARINSIPFAQCPDQALERLAVEVGPWPTSNPTRFTNCWVLGFSHGASVPERKGAVQGKIGWNCPHKGLFAATVRSACQIRAVFSSLTEKITWGGQAGRNSAT